jgi:hypothetical protein
LRFEYPAPKKTKQKARVKQVERGNSLGRARKLEVWVRGRGPLRAVRVGAFWFLVPVSCISCLAQNKTWLRELPVEACQTN